MESFVLAEVGCAKNGRLSNPQRIAPPRLLPLRPALVAALATTGCRAFYAVTFGVDGGALAAADGSGCTYLWDTDGGLAAAFTRPVGICWLLPTATGAPSYSRCTRGT